ncbi:hypothetical protein [Cellulomonas shaoxiangyii]|uniref:Uncharacterized protein n=1 Tax=Cellulomonas shaoxiangyii TaxID=2566013 RepID=A0A4P7SLA7_9CELL|nr:hypothetical protein [Cellulomonas shaoxiangyii]QCB95002.1 hypothetical protein E5225_16960 [Cellulomonas shaoxiangyii]TGY85289.1 hypothetical protein E5226_07325 [Cellulomonas shaoxiangyii]
MSELSTATVPGRDVAFDEQARLRCPECGSIDLTVTDVDRLPDVAWVNHTASCGQCGTASTLALVSVFGHVVLRWLPDAR